MATQIIPDTSDALLLSVVYDATGLATATVFDNPLLGWAIDDTGATAAKPLIVGTLPPLPPATAPIISPQWAKFYAAHVFVPDVWRGVLYDWFTWLATNNGANRRVKSSFVTPDAKAAWSAWSQQFPSRVAP